MVIVTFLVVLGISFLIFLWKGGSITGYLIFFIFFSSVLLSRRFTKSLKVDTNYVNIEYIRWFIRRVLNIETNKVTTKIGKAVANRAGTKYIKIDFLLNSKIVYTVNSNDGFSEDELIDFASRVSEMSATISGNKEVKR